LGLATFWQGIEIKKKNNHQNTDFGVKMTKFQKLFFFICGFWKTQITNFCPNVVDFLSALEHMNLPKIYN
jgi:hypothetical protein